MRKIEQITGDDATWWFTFSFYFHGKFETGFFRQFRWGRRSAPSTDDSDDAKVCARLWHKLLSIWLQNLVINAKYPSKHPSITTIPQIIEIRYKNEVNSDFTQQFIWISQRYFLYQLETLPNTSFARRKMHNFLMFFSRKHFEQVLADRHKLLQTPGLVHQIILL